MKYEKGNAIISIYDFVEGIIRSADEATQREVCDSLACLDPVIDHVAAQIVEGWTEFDSHAADDYPAQSDPGTALSRARRYIAKNAGDVAKEEIERLEQALRVVEERAAKAEQSTRRAFDYVLDNYGEAARYRCVVTVQEADKAVRS